jgi:hypothetical protein
VLDFPHYNVRGRTRTNGAIRSFEPVGNPALGQIIWRHFDQHFVAGELATILLPNCSVRRSTRQHKAAQGSTRQHKAAQGSTRQHKAAQGSTRQHKAAQGSIRALPDAR